MRTWTRLSLAFLTAAAPVALAAPAQAATTTALWHMESVPTMDDSSGNNNTGTTTAVTIVPGSSGNGYHFDGAAGVTVPNSASLNPGTEDFKITMSVRFDAPPSVAVADFDLIRKGLAGTTGGEFKMEILPKPLGSATSPAYCHFQDSTGKTAFIYDTRNLADGLWHTISCVKNATAIAVVVDGVTTTQTVTLGSIGNTKVVEVGRKTGGGDEYLGDMDEVSMEVGPQTIADTTAPTVTAQSPASGATGVTVGSNTTATFSEPVQGVNGSSFTLTGPTGAVPALVSQSGTTNKWILDPNANLAGGTTYTVNLTNAITDTSTNALVPVSWSFTTAGTAPAPPTVTGRFPVADATAIALGISPTATFNKPVQGVNGSTFTLTNDTTHSTVAAVVSQSGTTNKWILNPNANLAGDTHYTVTLTGGSGAIRDMANTPLSTTTWGFLTGPAPKVNSTVPANAATGVSITAPVKVTFSEPVLNANETTITLAPTGGSAVTATVARNGTTNQWILTPSAPLAHVTNYTVTIGTGTGITDAVGNPLKLVTKTFTTG
jgi:nitrogen fixation protein FixH